METKEETVKTHVSLTTIVCVCIFVLSTAAQGVVIPLSTHSSEDPNVPASWLDATMDLSVNKVGEDWELTLAVTNLTPENVGDIAFKISELYFNTSAPITNLELESVEGGLIDNWVLSLDNPNPLGPFGLFDISIKSIGQHIEWIDPYDTTVTFKMNIEGDEETYSDDDFYDLSAWHETGKVYVFGAAKFFAGGPEDLSAYGGYVPEPATILLLGLGMLGLLRKRRS